jgi:hypothetical protein
MMGDIRLDENGGAWQPCPRCGLDRIVAARRIRAHDQFCNGAFQPFMSILAACGLRPFERSPWINPQTGCVEPRVLGELLPLRWRVARDQWYRLHTETRRRFGKPMSGTEDLPSTLYGWPIEVDSALFAGAIILETVG